MQFACGLCRQLRNTIGLIHEMTVAVQDEDEESAAVGLFEHLALVNEHETLVEEEGSLMPWAQEVISRAYALQICLR